MVIEPSNTNHNSVESEESLNPLQVRDIQNHAEFVDESNQKSSDIQTVGPGYDSESTDQNATSLADPKAFVESTVDDLMHEVFDDVDRMLDNRFVVPLKSSNSKVHDDQKFSAVPQHSGDALSLLHLSDVDLENDPQSHSEDSTSAEHTPASEFKTILVKLAAIVAASVGVGVGLGWWMAQRQQTVLVDDTSAGTAVVSSDSENETFERYLLDALDTIDRKYERVDQSVEVAILPDDNSEEEAITDESNEDIEGIDTASTVLPPIPQPYVQVYPPSQTVSVLPQLPAASVNPAPAASPEVVSEGSNVATSAPSPAPNIEPHNAHTLVGILELDERSAAIFEFSGSAHRVELGEQIGSSGWSLVSVSGQEVIIRRNGAVHSMLIQQSLPTN